ncbi:hypothetical protein BGZ63DRAFT_490428 [Mariannaea sp. PMI_226]|nr:hypothetical protein BGZ63DRAFT_490428 [Mariannaea sp. PMI_226]
MDHSLLPAPATEAPDSKFLHIPYGQRWEPLKPTIIKIYLQENNRIARLADRMKNEFQFDAKPHQYRYYFKKWDIKKRTTREEKTAVITALGKRRLRDGVSTSDAAIVQGGVQKAVDKKQLKRHIQDNIRHDVTAARLRPGLFLQHSLPYAAITRNQITADSPVTPQYLSINSPESVCTPSSPSRGQSPTMQLIQRKVLVDRATLFLDGRERDLLSQMSPAERKSWTLPLIRFKSLAGLPMPSTPEFAGESEELRISPTPIAGVTYLTAPTQLCRWAIHYKEPEYDDIPSLARSSDELAEEMYDIEDESTWTPWLVDGSQPDISTTMSQGLRQGDFTAIESHDVPLATDVLVDAAEKSKEELDAEAYGFAIMSRNMKVIIDMVEKYDDELPETMGEVFPFHLAARHLDGAKTCCSVFELLLNLMHESNSIGVRYIDGHGHTVLDAFFVKILRSHSTVPAHIISDVFSSQDRCEGDEVDPCGRWDADSPCVRQLHGSGHRAIPGDWKHTFCHTSVQAICHCLALIFMGPWRPNINTGSGLFKKRCGGCGMELAIGPLHALVLTAYHLANNATPGENLFGIIASLTRLLTLGADPCLVVEVSILELFGEHATAECHHTRMNPAELGSKVPPYILRKWSTEVQQGWRTFLAIITFEISCRKESKFEEKDISTTIFDSSSSDEDGEDDAASADSGDTTFCSSDIHDIERRMHRNLVYCGNTQLGILWMMIQGEFLTYRRLTEGASWLSPRFNMQEVLGAMDKQEPLPTKSQPTQADEGFKKYSRCGFFHGADHPGCARREEVCTSYFANFDDWSRTTFIVPVVGLTEVWGL